MILSAPEGHFLELAGDASHDDALVVSEGGMLRRFELQRLWEVTLPVPTRAFSCPDADMRSFQGPPVLP